MSSCYTYDTINFNTGLLDSFIDCVYVLLLEGSNRTKSVYTNLHKHKLCKKNIVVINKKDTKNVIKTCANKPPTMI